MRRKTVPVLKYWSSTRPSQKLAMYMASVHTFKKTWPKPKEDEIPMSSWDFCQCVDLVEAFPRVKLSFPAISERHNVWRGYLDHWDELAELCKNAKHDAVWYRMREIRFDYLRP